MAKRTPMAIQVTAPQSGKAGPDRDQRNLLEGDAEKDTGGPVEAGVRVELPRAYASVYGAKKKKN